MKVPTILSVAAVAVLVTSAGLAANYDDLVAQGYRWVTVDGPYACPSKDDLRTLTKHPTDEAELQMIEQLRAYYLIEGALLQVVVEDAASGMSQIHATEINPIFGPSLDFSPGIPLRTHTDRSKPLKHWA